MFPSAYHFINWFFYFCDMDLARSTLWRENYTSPLMLAMSLSSFLYRNTQVTGGSPWWTLASQHHLTSSQMIFRRKIWLSGNMLIFLIATFIPCLVIPQLFFYFLPIVVFNWTPSSINVLVSLIIVWKSFLTCTDYCDYNTTSICINCQK